MRTRSALLTLIFLLGQLSPRIHATPGESIVSFSVDSDGAVVVPVAIGENRSFRFVLDTGASHSVVSDTLAQRLGLLPVAQSRIVTSAGDAAVAVVELEDVAVGDVVARRLMPSIVNAASLDALVAGVDGVLGRDFLASHDFTIDYGRKRLVWGPPHYHSPGRGNGVRVPLTTRNGRFVTLLQQDNHAEIVLVPDTGAGGIILYDNDRSRRLPLALTSNDRALGLTGLAGSRMGWPVHLKVLRIGTVILRDQPAALVPTAADEHLGVDGLLPLHIFSRVSFRPAEGYLTIDW